ncbi:hypothetical protein QF045_001763 [Pseudomonas sp. W4I3]|nr:hypothetical protein [Pseudomonas sp. W4I3]
MEESIAEQWRLLINGFRAVENIVGSSAAIAADAPDPRAKTGYMLRRTCFSSSTFKPGSSFSWRASSSR